ncbi:MAG: hypothetical protein HYY45_04225 [Deltaproteobacteria bacterium]|nr:hypothetical protein [Deltaproteobacteria bacterium]
MDKFVIAGTVAECRTQVKRLKKSGINQIAIIPYGAKGEDRLVLDCDTISVTTPMAKCS